MNKQWMLGVETIDRHKHLTITMDSIILIVAWCGSYIIYICCHIIA